MNREQQKSFMLPLSCLNLTRKSNELVILILELIAKYYVPQFGRSGQITTCIRFLLSADTWEILDCEVMEGIVTLAVLLGE